MCVSHSSSSCSLVGNDSMYFSTMFVSNITVCLGKEGRFLNIPFSILEIAWSFPNVMPLVLSGNMADSMERAAANVPYFAVDV